MISLNLSEDTKRLCRLAGAMFIMFLAIGIPLPVIPLYVRHELGLNDTMVGIVIGIQFLATIFTRGYAGKIADECGAKRSVMQGMISCSIAGVIYLAPVLLPASVSVKFVFLLISRLMMGFGESQLLTGTLAWGIALLGPQKSGRVMSWNGMAIFSAMAIGAPLGLVFYEEWGFITVGVLTILCPLLAFLLDSTVEKVPPHPGKRLSFLSVIGMVWKPGTAMALQTVGFVVIGTFISLFFYDNDWAHAGIAMSFFGGSFVLVRVFWGNLPDKLGGTRVALISLLIEISGQIVLWTASSGEMAWLGCALTGAGSSLVFPALGVEIIRRVPSQMHGTAMGCFSAFMDFSYLVTNPLAGMLAGAVGYASVFLAGGICALLSMVIVVLMWRGALRASRKNPPDPA